MKTLLRSFLIFATTTSCSELAGQTYRDPGGRFTVDHPASFVVREEKNTSIFARKDSPDIVVTISTALKHETGRPNDRTLGSSSSAARTMLRSLPKASITSERAAAVSGQDATVFETTFRHRERTFFRRQWVIEGKTDIAYLALTAPVSKVKEGEPVVAAMLASLALSEGAVQ